MRRRTIVIALVLVAGATCIALSRREAPSVPAPPPVGMDLAGDPLPPWAVARMGSLRHPSCGSAVAFTADSERLLCAGRDGVLRTFDLATGAMLREERPAERFVRTPRRTSALQVLAEAFDPPPDPIVPDLAVAMTISRKGNLAFCGPTRAALRAPDGAIDSLLLTTPPLHACAVALTPDGACAAVACDTGGILVGMPPTPIASMGLGPQGVALSADGRLVAVQAQGVHLLDATTGAVLGQTKSTAFAPSGIAFSSDGSRLVHAHELHGLFLRDTKTFAVVWGDADTSRSNWGELAFSPDDRRIACATTAGLAIVDAADGTSQRTLAIPGGAWRVAWSPDGKRLAASGCSVNVWETTSWTTLLPAESIPTAGLEFSPDGARLLTWAMDGAAIWEARTGALVRRFATNVREAAWTRDGLSVLCVTLGSVETFDATKGARTDSFAIGPSNGVHLHGPSPALLRFSQSGPRAGRHDFVDARTQAVLATFGRPNIGGVRAASRDGRLFAATPGTSPLEVFDLATGAVTTSDARWAWRDGMARLVALSDDGSRVAACLEHGRVVAARTAGGGRASFDTELHGAASAFALSADGSLAAIGDAFGDVHLWSLEDEVRLVTFHGHRGTVHALAFAPAGSLLASAAEDGTILVWDVSRFER